jgi:hypothetical protein
MLKMLNQEERLRKNAEDSKEQVAESEIEILNNKVWVFAKYF